MALFPTQFSTAVYAAQVFRSSDGNAPWTKQTEPLLAWGGIRPHDQTDGKHVDVVRAPPAALLLCSSYISLAADSRHVQACVRANPRFWVSVNATSSALVAVRPASSRRIRPWQTRHSSCVASHLDVLYLNCDFLSRRLAVATCDGRRLLTATLRFSSTLCTPAARLRTATRCSSGIP